MCPRSDSAKVPPSLRHDPLNVTSTRWREIAPSEFPWEREALAFVRERLPEQEPYRAWANLEFMAEDGTHPRGGPAGAHSQGALPGRDQELARHARRGRSDLDAALRRHGRRRSTARSCSPTARRASSPRCSSARRRPAARSSPSSRWSSSRIPASSSSSPAPPARGSTCATARPARAAGLHPARPGIVAALTRFDPSEPVPGRPRPRLPPVARAVERAVEEAGIRPSQRARRVGDYLLEDLLYTGPNYQDWQARHVSAEKIRRRVRLYPLAAAAGAEAREQLERAARREMEILETAPASRRSSSRCSSPATRSAPPSSSSTTPRPSASTTSWSGPRPPRLREPPRPGPPARRDAPVRPRHRVFHRALSPQSVLVQDPEAERRRSASSTGRPPPRRSSPPAPPGPASPAPRTSTSWWRTPPSSISPPRRSPSPTLSPRPSTSSRSAPSPI